MSSFGRAFRVTTFGESHCKGVGCIVDGCPALLELTEEDIQPQLTRRRPGQSAMTTKRDEADQVTILSGTERGVTLGTPIGLFVKNRDMRPGDYKEMSQVPRPSHADYTYQVKYGVRASSGGGRSSARETIGRVAAGAIAEKWLHRQFGTEIVAYVSQVGNVAFDASEEELAKLQRSDVDQTSIRCPEPSKAEAMEQIVKAARAAEDSIGGCVSCVIRNVPAGLGEPCFDKLEAMLAHAMLSIPATKGFEIGSGFRGVEMRGSEHNDAFVVKRTSEGGSVELGTASNNSGGTQGGISNGESIHFRIAFKPPATIGRAQNTTDFQGNATTLEARGRHDPCVVPRAVPIVEAMAALVIMDAAMLQQARTFPPLAPVPVPEAAQDAGDGEARGQSIESDNR